MKNIFQEDNFIPLIRGAYTLEPPHFYQTGKTEKETSTCYPPLNLCDKFNENHKYNIFSQISLAAPVNMQIITTKAHKIKISINAYDTKYVMAVLVLMRQSIYIISLKYKLSIHELNCASNTSYSKRVVILNTSTKHPTLVNLSW